MPSKKEEKDATSLPTPKFTIIPLPQKNSQMRFLRELPSDLTLDEQSFNDLWSMIPDEPSSITCFGKKFSPKRKFKSFGEDYHFSQENHQAECIENPFLKKILHWVQDHSEKPFNQILINWYIDGSAYISPHADDESQLEEGSSIYSFSFGQTRDFVITNKKKKGQTVKPFSQKITLPNNSLLIMEGDMQKHFLHSIPVRSIKTCPGKRINITVRCFKKKVEDVRGELHH